MHLVTRHAVWCLLLCTTLGWAQPVADWHLRDVNVNSPRRNALVSPRDYILQISAYYFGAAG